MSESGDESENAEGTHVPKLVRLDQRKLREANNIDI